MKTIVHTKNEIGFSGYGEEKIVKKIKSLDNTIHSRLFINIINYTYLLRVICNSRFSYNINFNLAWIFQFRLDFL